MFYEEKRCKRSAVECKWPLSCSKGAVTFTVTQRNPVVPTGICTIGSFAWGLKCFSKQISFLFKLLKWICRTDQQKAAWFEGDFCLSCMCFIHLLTMDLFAEMMPVWTQHKPVSCSMLPCKGQKSIVDSRMMWLTSKNQIFQKTAW